MRDFEDEWEDIGMYLLSTGWDVVHEERYKHTWEYGAEHTGLGFTGGNRGSVEVLADLPTGRSRRDGTYEVRLNLPKIIGSRRLPHHEKHRQRVTFFAALSDIFGDVSIVDYRTGRKGIPSIGGERDIDWYDRDWPYAYFKMIPSAEDVIGIIEAFALTQMEMRDA